MSFGEVKLRKPNLRLVVPPPGLKELRDLALIYLATPITKYEGGIEAAEHDAIGIALKLHAEKVFGIYCPVMHWCTAAYYGERPTDYKYWKEENEHKLRVASALLIGKLPGWDQSDGIQSEVEYAKAWNKRIYLIDPETLDLELRT